MEQTGTFQKTMLRVGEYHSPDGKVCVTPRRLRHWASNFQRLDSAKQVVPMHWDHGSDVDSLRPLSEREFSSNRTRSAKNSVGKLTDFKVSADGKSAEITFQTLEPAATRKVASNAVYVSPVIFPQWKDGAGNQYKDLITHLDLVNHPVDHSQSLAKPVSPNGAVACALRMGLGTQPYRLGAAMADKDYEKDEMLDDEILDDEMMDEEILDEEMGDEDEADMLGDDLAGDPDFEDEMMDDGEEIEDFDAELDDLGMDTGEELEMDVVDDGSAVGDLMLALADHDVVLPEDTTMENFMDRLRTALIAKKGGSADAEPNDNGFDDGDTIVADPQIATMSAFANKSYNAKINRQLTKLLKSGRCTPAEYRQRKKQASTVRLSLNAQGKPKQTILSAWIKSRASLPAGATWSSREKLRRMSSVAQPKSSYATRKSANEMSAAELDKEVEKFFRRS